MTHFKINIEHKYDQHFDSKQNEVSFDGVEEHAQSFHISQSGDLAGLLHLYKKL